MCVVTHANTDCNTDTDNIHSNNDSARLKITKQAMTMKISRQMEKREIDLFLQPKNVNDTCHRQYASLATPICAQIYNE